MNDSPSKADKIRDHALERHVRPWRLFGKKHLSIRAGDVVKEMGFGSFHGFPTKFDRDYCPPTRIADTRRFYALLTHIAEYTGGTERSRRAHGDPGVCVLLLQRLAP